MDADNAHEEQLIEIAEKAHRLSVAINMAIATRGDRMGAPLTVTRLDNTPCELRSFASKCPDGAQVRRLWRWPWFWKGGLAAKRLRTTAWFGKRCGTGSIVTTRPGSMALRPMSAPAARRL